MHLTSGSVFKLLPGETVVRMHDVGYSYLMGYANSGVFQVLKVLSAKDLRNTAHFGDCGSMLSFLSKLGHFSGSKTHRFTLPRCFIQCFWVTCHRSRVVRGIIKAFENLEFKILNWRAALP